MKRPLTLVQVLRALQHYAVFFLVMAFAITCCTMLFVQTMTDTMHIALTSADIRTAAKLTFVNVVVLSLICTLIDGIRRRVILARPVHQITRAAEKIMAGDFSVRIPEGYLHGGGEMFAEIVRCFNRMAEELSGTQALRTDFIANVSHELKTPLTVMQNYATLLQQPGLPETQRQEYAKAVADACRRLSTLVTNILRLNKLENQQTFPGAEVFDLSEQLCRCLLEYEDVWEKKEITIDAEIAEGVHLRSDEELLQLVWGNLLSNAMKFTPQGGTVSVRLEAEEDAVLVQIADTGCGISREAGAHIFEKFYQGDPSHASQGNGLGLALVKRIIDVTGSDISVESEVGKGSTFTVRLRRDRIGETENLPG